MTTQHVFEPLFRPRSIAVVGASSSAVSGGNRFITNLRSFGFDGEIWPVHPTAIEIEGIKAYCSLAELPGVADYAYVAVNSLLVPSLIRQCKDKVRIVQVMSSGFSETGAGLDLERELVEAARGAGVRVVGPNCLGTYSPAGRLTFTANASTKAGHVGVVCQSGGLGVDIIRRGKSRGVQFSAVVTVGNCADVKPWELLDYFLNDPQTDVIGLYLESALEGRKLFEVLRQAKARKPVVLLKGASTEQGQVAAISHTGALAGNGAAWQALVRQTGLASVQTVDQFVNMLLLFQCLSPIDALTDAVILFGNGGGTSVLGADAFSRQGFALSQLDFEVTQALKALNLPAGSSIHNPIDVPAGALQAQEGRIADKILAALRPKPQCAVIIHINMTVVSTFKHIDLLGNLMRALLRMKQQAVIPGHVMLVLRSDGELDIEQKKQHYWIAAVGLGIPVFDELVDAANALAGMQALEKFRMRFRDIERSRDGGGTGQGALSGRSAETLVRHGCKKRESEI